MAGRFCLLRHGDCEATSDQGAEPSGAAEEKVTRLRAAAAGLQRGESSLRSRELEILRLRSG